MVNSFQAEQGVSPVCPAVIRFFVDGVNGKCHNAPMSWLWSSSWVYRLIGHVVSGWVGRLVGLPLPVWARKIVLGAFNRGVGVVAHEAEFPLTDYPTLGAWFTRGLRPGCRPLAPSPWVSPVDGVIIESGAIRQGTLIQAKGLVYSTADLLLEPGWDEGTFWCVYLSPKDCHRIMSPVAGQLTSATLIPGHLYPVRHHCIRTIPRLYCVNERLVMRLDTPMGRLAMVAVGALNVGSISTTFDSFFHGQRLPAVTHRTYPSPSIPVAQGDWMATFHLGSTVILMADATVSPIPSGTPIQIGQSLIAHA